MMWIGLIVGVVVGGLIWEGPGAVTLGFVGWLAGLIYGSMRRSAGKPVSVGAPASVQADRATIAPATAEPEALDTRLARLEGALARVELRLARLDPSFVPTVAVGSTPAPTPVAEQPELPLAEPQAVAAAAAPSSAEIVREPEPASAAAPERPPEPEVAPEPPGPPPEPNPIVAWFMGVNTIARVGMVILFFGLAFLIKYAADNNMFPPELRVAAVGVAGIALLAIGWRTRERKRAFALGMQGTGVAVLYLTIFGAMKLYGLIPPELAFFLLAAIAVFSAILAVLQGAESLAVIGAGGGFLAPILASTGGGDHVMLFSYYVVLNAGIVAIAYFRAWRVLNLAGFLFTFFIGLSWGSRFYRPELLETTEPFLVTFFLMYVAIGVLVARESSTGGERFVHGTIVFGAPLAAFGLQAVLMRDIEYGLAFSALAVAALYVLLAWRLLKSGRENWRLLAQAYLAMGVAFATLAIPLALDARWTSASWALEGAAIFWIGLRQRRTLARAFGLFLQLAAGVSYFNGYQRVPEDLVLANPAFLGSALMAIAGLWINRLLRRNAETVTVTERFLTIPVFAWGLLWTLFAGIDEMQAQIEARYAMASLILFFSAVAVAFGMLGKRWTWREATWTARALLPILILIGLVQIEDSPHPLGKLGSIAWPIAFVVHVWILRTVEPERGGRYAAFLHSGGMLLAALLGARELHWIASRYAEPHTAWSLAALTVAPAALLMIASSRQVDTRWPIAENAKAYRYWAAVPIVLYFACWSLFGNFTHDAASDPLPYLPLLNAVDLAHVLVAITISFWWMGMRRSQIAPPGVLTGRSGLVIAGGLAFVWLNAILLRTLSHWFDIPYDPGAMSRSVLAQASLSVFWTVLALTAMVYATRSARRVLWMLGAGLMGVVVAKLFLMDLSHVTGIERIVSFIAVGVLMLVVGYFSPVPPKQTEEKP